MIEFEWDPNKAAIKLQKHGFSFEQATTAFADPFGLIIFDPDRSEEEDHFILLGMSTSARLLIVCHCHRNRDDEVIRVISARKTEPHERKQYGQFL